ncbi:hypothetical protein EDB85DRAFT_2282303 [Lactarius pseudohatsudake]|nr:hypothetical protein EDB85DRAFT_2282303 [Lactarius pseudohatsudake]
MRSHRPHPTSLTVKLQTYVPEFVAIKSHCCTVRDARIMQFPLHMHRQAGRQAGKDRWTMDDLPSDFLFELEHGRDDAHTLHGSLPDSTLGRVYRIYNRRQLHTLACSPACLSVLGVKPPVSPLFCFCARVDQTAVILHLSPSGPGSLYKIPTVQSGFPPKNVVVKKASVFGRHFDCESGAAAEPRNYCGAKTGWTQHDAPGAAPPRLSDLTVSIQTGVLAKSRTPGGKRGVLRSRPRIETGDLLYALRELLWARHYFFSRQDETCHTLAKRRGQEMVLSQRQTVQEERDVVMKSTGTVTQQKNGYVWRNEQAIEIEWQGWHARRMFQGGWTMSASACGVPAYLRGRRADPDVLLQEIRRPVGEWFGRGSDCVSSVPVKR